MTAPVREASNSATQSNASGRNNSIRRVQCCSSNAKMNSIARHPRITRWLIQARGTMLADSCTAMRPDTDTRIIGAWPCGSYKYRLPHRERHLLVKIYYITINRTHKILARDQYQAKVDVSSLVLVSALSSAIA